jgi:hypothetical protein
LPMQKTLKTVLREEAMKKTPNIPIPPPTIA